jgi:hypothetical protein
VDYVDPGWIPRQEEIMINGICLEDVHPRNILEARFISQCSGDFFGFEHTFALLITRYRRTKISNKIIKRSP